ncbi:hypothetical protein GCM10022243_61940 [Saccharothrix violaceirubra]|uniref:Tetratricopeptide (TPR) repeat protein n=1 Tax=Saccharothrix violaceirubra TaxID=413306 RepID=A0A7W7T7Y2_9PSEU|nr:tetratricopeptide repeat protein [Saccharothrix violaceirubra]MBB4968170.1 tetratricopeptide (TPR) repeat protein [Saccharothrix violaceirubra]
MTGADAREPAGRPTKVRNDLSGGVVGASVQSGSIEGGVHVHLDRDGVVPVPRQLPAPPAWFTGRDRELDRLEEVRRRRDPDRPTVVVLTGPGGVGKTALSLRWANSLAPHYADGQLFVDLNGFSDDTPTDPGEAASSFLRALGVPATAVPAHLAEQTALYRTVTADRSLIVVLDNALSAAQVKVLVPSSPAGLVVVTSRSKLTGLLGEGAHIVEVGPLAPSSAFTLLARSVGEDRVTRERDRAEELVSLCGGLPIAVRVAAARLLVRSRWSVGRVHDELVDEQSRLNRLSPDGELSVRATFDLSYRMLEPRAATLYRRLSLHPHGDFGPEVASSVLDDGQDTEPLLDALLDASLIEERAENRYVLHDLLRLHARHRLDEDEPPGEPGRVLRRIAEWYLATAMRADKLLTPHRRRLPYGFATPAPSVRSFADRAEALEWLEDERVNLMAAGRIALEHDLAELSWHLSDVLWPLFLLRKHHRDRLEADRRGVVAARRWGNTFAEADMLRRLGRALTTARDHHEAERCLDRAIDLWRGLDDDHGVSTTRELLGLLYRDTGRLDEAHDQFTAVVEASEALDAPRPVGLALINLALVLIDLGRAADALPHLDRAARLFATLDPPDPYNAARVTVTSAAAQLGAGDPVTASDTARKASAQMDALGSVPGLAEAHRVLGEAVLRTGGPAAAHDHLAAAERLFRSIGSVAADAVRERLDALGPTG